MNKEELLIEEVICPWCMNLTKIIPSEEVQQCQICRREFTEGDINENNEED